MILLLGPRAPTKTRILGLAADELTTMMQTPSWTLLWEVTK